MIKKIIFTFLSVILASEIIVGYLAFQLQPQISKSSILSLVNIPKFIEKIKFDKTLNKTENLSLKEYKIYLEKKVKKSLNENTNNYYYDNPFLADSFVKKNMGYAYHPFIDFSNVHSFNHKFSVDYFGFRNKKNYYFNKNNNFKIIITGGSECAGFSHKTTISEFLNQKLNNFYETDKIDVINLCMNSYTIFNEIQSFVNIGMLLDPDIVISHTGYNDSLYSVFVSKNFFELGLIYFIGQEQWKNMIYGKKVKKDREYINSETVKNFDPELFFSVMNNNYSKYKKIVESNGARLILGLQPYKKSRDYANEDEILNYKKIAMLNMEEMNNNFNKIKIEKINFFKLYEKLKFEDSVHTDTNSAEIIAEKYLEYIINNHNKLILKKIN